MTRGEGGRAGGRRWRKIQSGGRLCPIPLRNQIFGGSRRGSDACCGSAAAAHGASPLGFFAGSLAAARIPRKSARCGRRRRRGDSKTMTAVKTSPHPTSTPPRQQKKKNPAGEGNVSHKTALSSPLGAATRTIRDGRRCFGLARGSPAAWDHGSVALARSVSLAVLLCFSDR